jgi:gluconolactonase
MKTGILAALLVAQTAVPRLPPASPNPSGPSLQAPLDSNYAALIVTNGVILSSDEKTVYVTNGATLAAFDVQPDGSLTNQREFVKYTASGGDGSTIDSQGRVYVTSGAGVEVIGRDGRHLGVIPTPRGVMSCAFGGKEKKTLFILARGAQDAEGNEVANAAQIWTIEMIAQGYKGRAK